MENTRLIELRGVYAKELATGRYLTAEQVCWRALEICGYRGSRRKFSYWLTTARLKVGMMAEEESLWEWACLLAGYLLRAGTVLGSRTDLRPARGDVDEFDAGFDGGKNPFCTT